jgi:hypothetical protein
MAAPSEGAHVSINGRVQKVTGVDEAGGFYARQEHDDGSGPTTHYWPAGTDWRCPVCGGTAEEPDQEPPEVTGEGTYGDICTHPVHDLDLP